MFQQPHRYGLEPGQRPKMKSLEQLSFTTLGWRCAFRDGGVDGFGVNDVFRQATGGFGTNKRFWLFTTGL